MATNNQDVDTQSRWKSRYYEALGEIEEREKQWRDAERLLRHLITRLTLAADNRHQLLNQSLTELRNAVRDGRDVLRLRELIDQISEQVAELDNMRSRNQEQTHPANILLSLMDDLQLQDVNTRELRQLKKQISQLNPGDDANEIYAEFVEILNSAIDGMREAAPTKSRKQKLLDRILQRQEKAEVPTSTDGETREQSAATDNNGNPSAQTIPQKLMAPAVGDLLLQLALRMPDAVKSRINFQALKKHTNRARARKDLIAIIDVIAQHVEAAYLPQQPAVITIDDDSVGAVAQAIHQFFQQLNPPQDLKSRVSELEKFYSESTSDIEGLIHCLNSLAEVVAEICNRLAFQREELETFFVDLSMRLEDLDIGLQKTGALYNESHQDNLHMDKAVHDELRGIQDSMQTASNLTQLKSAIQTRLDTIDQHLLRFRDAEQQRFEQAQQTITALAEKVTLLEGDSGQLRSRLEETQKQALRDVLTGIPNRQAYEERLASEIARCKRYGTPLSMVVWDVDKFKAINDSYGHGGGDRVLKVIAELLSTRVRETDFVARYGGEEFVMLMPETTAVAAMQVANKLRSDVELTPFHFHDTRVEVTISAGVAQYDPEELTTSLFERADAALYAAKEAGRNQVCSAESESPSAS
jgi:diguanylate cyclase